jgi:bifunctional UDP-N-acetylglucosamine pyrophosphorylase/glucosamine-1-phosphate N-acetyltransferase
VLATATPSSPRAYGRILRQGDDVLGIVEDKQCTPEQKQIRELNAGFYCFSTGPLWQALGELRTDNPHGEYYLTDTIALLAQRGERVRSFHLDDTDEILGINDRVELVEVDRLIRQRKVRSLLENGVTIYNSESVVIDNDVEVGADTVIEAGVHLLGATRIGAECRIRTGSILDNARIGDGVTVKPYCVLESAEVGAAAQIGPYSRLREGAQIADEAHIGNFVEVKKSKVGRGTKAMHLAYLGDAEVGAKVNIGAGTITCNYDGQKKHRTGIGDGSFVGSNSTLVAPVEIGAGAYVGAGSVITEAVPAESLALGRSRQTVKEGWVKKRRARDAASTKKR